jgi:ectoine hydroxylase-related dioxygenase (phytanoyl-CoA dioxygenase family)
MTELLVRKIDEFGFANYPQIIDDKQIENLLASLSGLSNSSTVSKKKGATYGVRNLLNLLPEIRKFVESEKVKNLIEKILGAKAKPVRAIFFDKTPEANWKVPWHQDLTIVVREKRETAGFTAWTRKAQIHHVQAPTSVLETMLAVRIHLDDADETNGALKVIPKSHKYGRLNSTEIQNLRKTNKAEVCRIKRGEAFLMRPLIVHSSSAGTNPKHRRVIHIEFSADVLPNSLEWYGS